MDDKDDMDYMVRQMERDIDLLRQTLAKAVNVLTKIPHVPINEANELLDEMLDVMERTV